MGDGKRWTDEVYDDTRATKAAKGIDFYSHDADVKAGKVNTLHDSVNPKIPNKAGKLIRESLDSTDCPDAIPIWVCWDVTGSMATMPRTFLDKIKLLMAMIIKKGYIANPHIGYGAIGDATCDRFPLQFTQLESSNAVDDQLANLILEGGGGGQQSESYELAMYYLSRHCVTDSWNKRKKKGYIFMIGDELPGQSAHGRSIPADYDPRCLRSHIKQFIGTDVQADIPMSEILADLRERWEVFWVYPKQAHYYNAIPDIHKFYERIFGQQCLYLDKADEICELIAATIGVYEGFDLHAIADDLIDAGASKSGIDSATRALSTIVSSGAISRTAKTEGELAVAGTDNVDRL